MTTTNHKAPVTEIVLDVLGANPHATAAELALSTGLGRSTVGKALVTLEGRTKVTRTPGTRGRYSPGGRPLGACRIVQAGQECQADRYRGSHL